MSEIPQRVNRESPAYRAGAAAFYQNEPSTDNPWFDMPDECLAQYNEWAAGWLDALGNKVRGIRGVGH